MYNSCNRNYKLFFSANGPLVKQDYINIQMFFPIRYVWRKSPHFPGIERDLVSSLWPTLPSGFDAAYEIDKKDQVFLFKGTHLKFLEILPTCKIQIVISIEVIIIVIVI